MTDIQITTHFGQPRIVMDANNEPWFVAKDVCEALGYAWKGIATISNVPEEWRGVYSVQTPSGEQEMLCLSEQGLYFFLGRSDKEAALPYQKMIAGEVMPSIRKTGGYGTVAMTEKDILTQALQIIGNENAALVRQLEAIEPKADFADAVSEAEGGISVNAFAKVLRQIGIKDMGPNRLYRELRKDGFVIHRHGKNWNLPRQRYVDKEWFRVTEYVTPGNECIVTDFCITGAGQQALLKFYKDKYGISRQLSLFDRNRHGAKIIPMPKREAVQ